MMFSSVKPRELPNPDLADLVGRTQKLTDGGYDLFDKNEASLIRLLERIIALSRQEEEWYVYFAALYEILYLSGRDENQNMRRVVKYAEIYYKDCALYMDQALQKYPNTDLGKHNTWIYHNIFNAYWGYYQIDDAKMETFMAQYRETAMKYGLVHFYYQNEMYLATLYHDAVRSEQARKQFEKHEDEIESCYICSHRCLFRCHLLDGRTQMAEELMQNLLNRSIPKKHQWCYEYCDFAEESAMYAHVLGACLTSGTAEQFGYFYQNYWQKLPREAKDNADNDALDYYLCAIDGNFDHLERSLQKAQENITRQERHRTLDNIDYALEWHCYLALLDRSGVHEVTLDLPGLPSGTDKKVSTLAASRYMETLADDYGGKFARARAKFDYQRYKKMHLECAGI